MDDKIQEQIDHFNPRFLYIVWFFGVQTFSYLDMGETVDRRLLMLSDEQINSSKKRFEDKVHAKSLRETSYNES